MDEIVPAVSLGDLLSTISVWFENKFANIRLSTLNYDLDQLEDATENTRAIMINH